MNAGIAEAKPRDEHEQEIGHPIVAMESFVQDEVGECHGGSGDAETEEGVQAESRAEEQCDDDESDGIVGNSEQQEEGHSGMTTAKYDAGDHRRECDVGCRGDCPTVEKGVGVFGRAFDAVPCVAKDRSEGECQEAIDADGAQDAACCCDERCGGLLRIVKCTTGECRFEDFFARCHKEEGHQEIVDKEVQVEAF